MNNLLQEMTDNLPTCDIKSKKEKGHYGTPHLVLLRYETLRPDQVTLAVLVPYREIYEDNEDGNKEKTWLSWLDFNGNVYLPIDDFLYRKWIPLDKVSPEWLEMLGITPPSEEQWIEAMT